jgi:SOS-response transcriptional repressor LexA
VSWANEHVARLQAGETVQFRPVGNSMRGRIESGQLVTVEPLGERDAEVGEDVLCRVNGKVYLHLVKAKHGGHYLIGNNVGRDNGWCLRPCIYGRVVRVEP